MSDETEFDPYGDDEPEGVMSPQAEQNAYLKKKSIRDQMRRYLETGKNSFTDHRDLKVGETAIRFKGQQEDPYRDQTFDNQP